MQTFNLLAQSNITSITPASIFAFGLNIAVDVDTITFQYSVNGGSVIRIAFNGSPDLSVAEDQLLDADAPKPYATFTSSTNASNDGTFRVVAVSDSSDYIDIFNPKRSDATYDEATDSPSVCNIKKAKSVVIKECRIVRNSASAGVKMYQDNDGSIFDTDSIILSTSSINETDGEQDTYWFSSDARMNIGAAIITGSNDDVTITLYGYYLY